MVKSVEMVKRDLEKARMVISENGPGGSGRFLEKYGEYSQIFNFSNDPLNVIYEGKDLTGKRVLTVGGSGDHELSMVLCGATEIHNFDINRLTEYFIVLKCAAIKGLPFEKIYSAFNFSSKIDPKEMRSLYEKIEQHLPEDVRLFWDYFYLGENTRQFRYLFFRHPDLSRHRVMRRIPYMTSKKYDELKERLPGVEMKFIASDLITLPEKLTESYDHINLSNILTCSIPEDNSLIEAVNALKAHLNSGGDMYCAYIDHPKISSEMAEYFGPIGGSYEEKCSLVKAYAEGYKFKMLVYKK